MSATVPRMAWWVAWACLAAGTAYGQTPTASASQPALEDAWAVVEPKPAQPESPGAAPAVAKDDGRLLHRTGRTGSGAVLRPRSARAGNSWMRTIGAMAGVVGLIVFLAWGYRAVAAGNLGLLKRPRRPGLIEIVSRTPLSPRQALVLVRVGPRMVLVGQSQDRLQTLDVIADADLTAQLAGQAASRTPASSVAEFHQCLEGQEREYEQPPPPRRRGRGEPSLDELRQNVLATIERLRKASGAA